MSGIQKAVKRAGGVNQLAEKVGTSRQLVNYWLAQGVVPAGWVIRVYDATRVAAHELNPEGFPKGRVEIYPA